MSYEPFAPEYYTLTDEEGNEIEFEVVGRCEYCGTEYLAVIPADAEIVDQCEYIILKTITEDGEEQLVSVEDDEEFDALAQRFDALFDEEMENDSP